MVELKDLGSLCAYQAGGNLIVDKDAAKSPTDTGSRVDNRSLVNGVAAAIHGGSAAISQHREAVDNIGLRSAYCATVPSEFRPIMASVGTVREFGPRLHMSCM